MNASGLFFLGLWKAPRRLRFSGTAITTLSVDADDPDVPSLSPLDVSSSS